MPTQTTQQEPDLILVRHGETDSNARDIWQGNQGDDPLNERGRMQSLATAAHMLRYIPVNTLYASDLRRAVETLITRPLGELLLAREFPEGHTIIGSAQEGQIEFEAIPPASPK